MPMKEEGLSQRHGVSGMSLDPGPASQSYTSQRLRLHYADWGNQEAPPLILIHGSRDHCRSWDWTAARLRHKWHVICPDLRGHGDSSWLPDGNYEIMGYVFDLVQLIQQQTLAPVTIVGHSLGGNIALRYAGLYPDAVRRLVVIEGLGPNPKWRAEQEAAGMASRLRDWIGEKQRAAGRLPKRYATLDDAARRMHEANAFLSEEQARHLTRHGMNRNEDGTYSWKFDPYLYFSSPVGLGAADQQSLWRDISCSTLLLYGDKSWASNPAEDGRLSHFRNARLATVPDGGHWLHHDQFDRFMDELEGFL